MLTPDEVRWTQRRSDDLAYVEVDRSADPLWPSFVHVDATTAATAVLVAQLPPFRFPGGGDVIFEFFSPGVRPGERSDDRLILILVEDGVNLGDIAVVEQPTPNPPAAIGVPVPYAQKPVLARRRLKYRGNHVYEIRAYKLVSSATVGDGAVVAGGGVVAGDAAPAYFRAIAASSPEPWHQDLAGERRELAYAEAFFPGAVLSVTGTNEATSNLVVTLPPIAPPDGEYIYLEFGCRGWRPGAQAGLVIWLALYEDGKSLGTWAAKETPVGAVAGVGGTNQSPVFVKRRLRYTGNHQYQVRSYSSLGLGVIVADDGSNGSSPCYFRATEA